MCLGIISNGMHKQKLITLLSAQDKWEEDLENSEKGVFVSKTKALYLYYKRSLNP